MPAEVQVGDVTPKKDQPVDLAQDLMQEQVDFSGPEADKNIKTYATRRLGILGQIGSSPEAKSGVSLDLDKQALLQICLAQLTHVASRWPEDKQWIFPGPKKEFVAALQKLALTALGGQEKLSSADQIPIDVRRQVEEKVRNELSNSGWVDPDARSRLEKDNQAAKASANSAAIENAELRTRQRELTQQVTALRDELTEAQRKLAGEGMKSAELSQRIKSFQDKVHLLELERNALNIQIEALKTQIGGEKTAESPKPVAQSAGKTAASAKYDAPKDTETKERFRLYCDGLIGRTPEALKREAKEGLSVQSRVETQTTFLDRDKSDLNPRYGMYRVINSLFGSPASLMGDPASVGESELGVVTAEQAQRIGGAVELLARGNTSETLTRYLVQGLTGARKYYDYGDKTETFLVGKLPGMTSGDKRFEKDKFFMNVPNLIASVEGINIAIKSISDGDNNVLLAEIKRVFGEIQQSKLVRELRMLARDNFDVYKADYSTDLESSQIGDKKAADVLIDVFKNNANDCQKLNSACQKLAVLLPFAEYHKQMTAQIPIETKRIAPNGDGLVLTDGRNPYAVLLSAAIGGRYLGSEGSDWYKWFDLYESHIWPPEVRYNDYLAQAINNEQPISLSVDPDRPIILLTGNNGAGKTRAMETVAQTVAHALVTGTNSTARVLHMSQMEEIRSLVGASRHTVELSSFQREAALLADAITTLSNKSDDERAILVVDEVGKGTDSRDAISLMTAVAEYCRRKNIYLLMATHHGKDFVGLADKLGLRDSMTILSPDFGTHQLNKYEEPVSSKGIEVMQTRSQKHQLPRDLSRILYENALRIRQAVLTDSIPTLLASKIEARSSGETFSFADEETLRDIGLSHEKRDYSDMESVSATEPLRKMARKAAAIETNWRARSAWDGSFFARLGEVMKLQQPGLDKEHILVKEMIAHIRKFSDGKWEFMRSVGAAFGTAHKLFGVPLSPDKLQEAEARYTRFQQGDLSKGLYFGDREKEEIGDFLSTFGGQVQRDKAFESVTSLGESLSNSGRDSLVHLGYKVEGFAKMREKLDEILTAEETRAQEQVVAYMRGQAAKAIRNRLTGYSTLLSDSDALDFAHQLGESVSSTSEFFENVAKRIDEGDSKAYVAFSRWLIAGQGKQKSYSYTWSAQDYMYREAKLHHLSEAAKTIESNRRKITQQDYTTPREANEISQTQIVESFLGGDTRPLFSLVRAAIKEKVYFDYKTGGEISGMIAGLDAGKFFAWQKFISEHSPVSNDLYAALGVPEGADEKEIKDAARKIARQNHPDVVTPVEWRGRDIAGAPENVRQTVESARVLYDKAIKAQKVLLDKNQRGPYDRNRNAKAVLDMAYYGTIVNAIDDLGWCEATYSSDGSFELGNSLAVGLLSTMEESQIIRQSLSIDPKTESVVIGGSNGNGKSQLLIQLASAFEWARTTGYVPAERAVLPKLNFVSCMVNAGESTEGKSSFQNEIDRYIDLFNRYAKACCPNNGIIFLDEPLAGTSSEDQIGILLSMIEFFRQRNVKVVFTNHNYKTYDYLRRAVSSDGSHIIFKPVAFLAGKGREKYTLSEFDASDTSAIRSDGVKVAGELGVPDELIQIAYFARQVLTGKTTAD